MNNLIQMVNQFKQNPMVMLSQKYNIPQNLNDPNEIIQHLLNTGQVSQSQYNDTRNQVKSLFEGNHFNFQ